MEGVRLIMLEIVVRLAAPLVSWMEIDGWSIRYSRILIVNRLCKMIALIHYASQCAIRYEPPATILHNTSFQSLGGKSM